MKTTKDAGTEGAQLLGFKDHKAILATVEGLQPNYTTHECLVEVSPIRMFNMNENAPHR